MAGQMRQSNDLAIAAWHLHARRQIVRHGIIRLQFAAVRHVPQHDAGKDLCDRPDLKHGVPVHWPAVRQGHRARGNNTPVRSLEAPDDKTDRLFVIDTLLQDLPKHCIRKDGLRFAGATPEQTTDTTKPKETTDESISSPFQDPIPEAQVSQQPSPFLHSEGQLQLLGQAPTQTGHRNRPDPFAATNTDIMSETSVNGSLSASVLVIMGIRRVYCRIAGKT